MFSEFDFAQRYSAEVNFSNLLLALAFLSLNLARVFDKMINFKLIILPYFTFNFVLRSFSSLYLKLPFNCLNFLHSRPFDSVVHLFLLINLSSYLLNVWPKSFQRLPINRSISLSFTVCLPRSLSLSVCLSFSVPLFSLHILVHAANLVCLLFCVSIFYTFNS